MGEWNFILFKLVRKIIIFKDARFQFLLLAAFVETDHTVNTTVFFVAMDVLVSSKEAYDETFFIHAFVRIIYTKITALAKIKIQRAIYQYRCSSVVVQ